MKKAIDHALRACLAALAFVLVFPIAAAEGFTIDVSSTSTSPMTGLWNNANESGWGTAIIQQYGIFFVTMYTYDGDGKPTWYVASNCAVANNGCTGSLYKVVGGDAPTIPWNGAKKAVTAVGTLSLAFSDINTGKMDFTIDGVSGSKDITRSVFASAPSPVASVPVLSPKPVNLNGSVTLGTSTWGDGATASGGHGAPVTGVGCLVTENYHIHAHLTILKNGQALAVPAHIGLQGCAYELHTHDQSGIIHVETSAYRRFTLGNFFSVWGQPLSYDNVAGITGLPVAVYVNDGGVLAQYKGNLGDLELTAHREITIMLGTVAPEIPSFKWDPTL